MGELPHRPVFCITVQPGIQLLASGLSPQLMLFSVRVLMTFSKSDATAYTIVFVCVLFGISTLNRCPTDLIRADNDTGPDYRCDVIRVGTEADCRCDVIRVDTGPGRCHHRQAFTACGKCHCPVCPLVSHNMLLHFERIQWADWLPRRCWLQQSDERGRGLILPSIQSVYLDC